jgi:hypothetical protein
MIQDFFGRAGKPPDQVSGQEVFAWAHGVGLSGKEPSAVTIGARMACLSSFYRFLIRMSIVKYEQELVAQFPDQFQDAVSQSVVTRVASVLSFSYGLSRPRTVVVENDGRSVAYNDEDPE